MKARTDSPMLELKVDEKNRNERDSGRWVRDIEDHVLCERLS